MSHIVVSFMIGVISGYLLNKMSSLFVIVILIFLISGYFLPGNNSGSFYHYMGNVFIFIKGYVTQYHFINKVSSIVGKANLMVIAFFAGMVIGFRMS